MILLLPFFISLLIYIIIIPMIKNSKEIESKNIIIFGLLSLMLLLISNKHNFLVFFTNQSMTNGDYTSISTSTYTYTSTTFGPSPEILLMLLLISIIIYWIGMTLPKTIIENTNINNNNDNNNNDNNDKGEKYSSNQIILLGSTFILGCYFALMSTNLVSFFVSIELLSFTMLVLVNLYIQDQYPGILYYLFSGLFSALFIFALGTMSMGYFYNLSVNILYIVFFYKLGLAPFHILLPQIYQNLSIQYILLMDIPYKIILFFLFAKIYWISCFNSLIPIILLSLIVGCIGSLRYKNLLSILIYSSLYHYGLILITINYFHLDYLFYYIFIYSFTIILYLYLITYKFIDRQIISYNKIYILLWFLLIMNLIGIPPFSGFFIKFYPLYITLFNYNYLLFITSIFGILLLTFTYLRILLSIMFGFELTHDFFHKSKIHQINKDKNLIYIGMQEKNFVNKVTSSTIEINNSSKYMSESSYIYHTRNNNITYSHFISSLIIILSIPILY